MKIKVTLFVSILIASLFGTGCASLYQVTAVYVVGQVGNIEKKSADFNVMPPAGFRETLTALEAKYNDEWTAFDQNINGCTVYYGWLRGNAIGEYKLKIREVPEKDLISVEVIALDRHGVGGMGISKYMNTGKRDKNNILQLPIEIMNVILGPKTTYFKSNEDKKAFLLRNSITVPLTGKDIWGPFSMKITGEFSNTEQMMAGTWDVNHGPWGNYKGTFYGVRLDSTRADSPSITDQKLYQSMIHFNP
jgi:hypothetical protein